jgi:hypothetical protein
VAIRRRLFDFDVAKSQMPNPLFRDGAFLLMKFSPEM